MLTYNNDTNIYETFLGAMLHLRPGLCLITFMHVAFINVQVGS